MLFAAPAQAQDKPNVIIVVWDATRPANLPVYGYTRDTTPNLSAWAEKATVFENAQSTSTWSVPSMAGMFTGLFSHNHRVDWEAKEFSLALPESAQTFSESMKGAGYATALYSAQGSYIRKGGFQQGFDASKHVSSEQVLKSGLEFLDAHKGQPNFLVLNWMDPHAPYEPEPVFDQWSATAKEPFVQLGQRDAEGWHKPYRVNVGLDNLSSKQFDRLRAQYDGELLQNDNLFGQLQDGLYDRGLRENTIIVFTASHGEGMGEHDRQKVWHDFPYDSVLDVPLIIGGPGFEATRVPHDVRTIDIYPTVTAAVGVPLTHRINGKDLRTVTTNLPNTGTSHFLQAPVFFRAGGYKLWYLRTGEPNIELYEVSSDAAEQDNKAKNKQLYTKVQGQYEAFLKASTIPLGE